LTTDLPDEAERPRILVVEDDPAQARLVAAVAQSIGMVPVGVAATGEAALGLAAQADIVLLDHQLDGGMTGLEVLREVRARALRVKVIVMTAYGSEQLAAEALRAGADDYLIKDTGFAEFLPQVLRRVAHLRRVEHALAEAQHQLLRAERRAAIGEVAVTISHEMNNPLMALRTQLELLRMDVAALPSDVRANLDGAIAQVDRIAAVVKRVADHWSDAAVSYVGATRMLDLSPPATPPGSG
jgi:DNA-binding response OmpR family regulator